MFPVLSDETIYRFTPDEPPSSADALAVRYARLERGVSPSAVQRWLNWIVVPAAGGEPLGYVQATVEDDVAWVAYVLASPGRGKGYAGEATALMLEHLRTVGVREARAEIDARNTASRRLIERLGFRLVSPGARDAEGVGDDGVAAADVLYAKRLDGAH